ncbi:hypothetical protein IAU59_006005 [Kwoniella sp. CBS 9459]
MASISTPTSLATFSQPHASSSKGPHITLSPVVGDAGSAVAAVRGDGVWTYDLSTLRPTTSFTVPPSTIFTSNAISYYTTTRKILKKAKSVDAQQHDDADVGDEGMDVDSEEGGQKSERDVEKEGQEEEETAVEEKERVTVVGVGKELWVWKGEEGDKEVISISTPIRALHHLPSTSATFPIIAISSSNDMYLLDGTFKFQTLPIQPRSGTSASRTSPAILASKVLSANATSFRLAVVSSEGGVAVHVVTLDGSVRSEIVVQGQIGVGGGKLGFAEISQDGLISFLDENNNLYTQDIASLGSATSLSPLKLNHPSSTPSLLSLPIATGRPVVLLPTSHPTPSILLTVPLSSLPAVLSTTSVSSLTSTSSGSISHLAILANKGGVVSVGVVLSHLNADGQSGRSVIHTCEIVLPPKGVGMSMLLGTKDKTETYLSHSASPIESSSEGSKSRSTLEVEKKQDDFIAQLSSSLKKNDISAATQQWAQISVSETTVTEIFVKRILSTIFASALTEEGKLKASSPSGGGYAAEIVRDLVKRGLVVDSMWKGGVVVDGLLPCGEWETILIALKSMRTIPSSALVALLTSTLHPDSTSPNAPVPDLSEILRLILASPPAPTFRMDLRRGLTVEDATSVLAVLVDWAEGHVAQRNEGLQGWDQEERAQVSTASSPLPSLESTITYSSLILDSHLPSFLSHEPSHTLLERLQTSLEPLMAMQMAYKQLRGPVEAVLILSRREARKAEEREAKLSSRAGKGGKGDKKKGAGAGAGLDKGGKLPEEVVGKWKVEDLVF